MARSQLIFLAAVLSALAVQARASGPGTTAPWYLDQFGGEAKDLARLYDGQLGIVMARSPRPQLYIAWRRLHGQKVGAGAGQALSIPCCSPPWSLVQSNDDEGVPGWTAARKAVLGAPDIGYLRLDREGPDYSSTPNCFDEAFTTAAVTLRARIASYGAGSPGVRAWLDAQDAVFKSCHDANGTLPAPPAGAPAWLAADRAYQVAAQALYDGRNDEAAEDFVRIAADRGSPWRASAPYLRTRALVRAALTAKTPEAYARAYRAIDVLAAMPAGTFGRDEATKMRQVVKFQENPEAMLAERMAELARRDPDPDIAVAFRDVSDLSDPAAPVEPIDWMTTLKAQPDQAALDKAGEDKAALAQVAAEARSRARAHATARWNASRDEAWLLAALSLAEPASPETPALSAAAQRVVQTDPAWLSLQFHMVRLTLTSAPPADTRARLDRILASPDLSVSDRNIFTAQRLQVANDIGEFTRLSLRTRLCPGYDDKLGCVRSFWQSDSYQVSGIYDGSDSEGAVGLGNDARAVIDRLPLAERIALSRDRRLPAKLRLDIALTSYARAVALHDEDAVGGLARDLVGGLPQMAADWRRIAAAPSSPRRRFNEYLVLAKIPGLRTDLADYQRPEGTVAAFQTYWIDWRILPKGRPDRSQKPRPLSAYQSEGRDPPAPFDALTDLTCLGECTPAPAPLRLPDFAQAAQARAAFERGYFVEAEPQFGWMDKPPAPAPAATVFVWEEMLAYAKAHPADPQVPEALYWLVHVGRFGGSHEHSGRRAFQLLHERYPETSWAKQTRYYYD